MKDRLLKRTKQFTRVKSQPETDDSFVSTPTASQTPLNRTQRNAGTTHLQIEFGEFKKESCLRLPNSFAVFETKFAVNVVEHFDSRYELMRPSSTSPYARRVDPVRGHHLVDVANRPVLRLEYIERPIAHLGSQKPIGKLGHWFTTVHYRARGDEVSPKELFKIADLRLVLQA